MTQDIETILRNEGIGTTITCGKAHMIAEKYHIHLTEIVSWCIKNNIKISQCMLGCFK